MHIAYWCVFFAGLMPICWQGIAKVTIRKSYENSRPRESLAQTQGVAQRASWAHDNSWEAFAPFAAAVIIAFQAGGPTKWINTLALIFIAARILYGLCYIFDKHVLRSSVWAVGFFSVAGLYLLAAGVV